MKKILKKILEYSISFILVICITTLIIILITSSTILNKSYVKSQMTQTGYYKKIYTEVQESIKSYIGPSGLEEEEFNEIITAEKVEEDTNIILDNIYGGIIEEVKTDQIKENLREKLVAINDNFASDERDNSVEEYINKIADVYINTLLHTNYEKDINKVMTKILKYINLAKKILTSVIAILMIVILVVNIKNVFKGFAVMAISILSSGIILELTNLFIKININIDNLLVMNEPFSNVLKNILNGILYKFEHYGLIMIAFGFIVIILGNIISNREKNIFRED